MKKSSAAADIIQSSSLGSEIVRRIQTTIVDGVYSRGDRLVETDLAEMFGVSRGPVRDALRVLATEGWVEIRPRLGAYVRNPDPDEVADFFHVKGLLEAEGARLACMAATPQDITVLRELVRQGDEAVERGDRHAMSELSTQFHMQLTNLSRNATLSEVLVPLQRRLSFFFTFTSGDEIEVGAWAEHAGLVDAIERGDGDAAAQLMREHSTTAELDYRAQMSSASPGS